MRKYLRLLLLIPGFSFGQNLDLLRKDVVGILMPVQGTFAVAFESLDGQARLFLHEKEMFHAASTMKTPVMIEVFRQAKEGLFTLEDGVAVQNEFKSIVDGTTYQLDPNDDIDGSMYAKIGSRVSIRELLHHMITVSSNLATNLLIDLVDPSKISATMRTLGANDIEVLRGVEDGKAFDRGLNNRTNAYDLLVIMRAVAKGQAVDSASSQKMVEILMDQTLNELIPALLPTNVRVAHKTGSITGMEHDSGIVFLPDGRRYILVILSKDLKDDDGGKRAIALVSKRIYDFMMNGI